MVETTEKEKSAEEITVEKNAEEITVKNRIHFADGNKGGVGKSFFCRTLYQCLLEKNIPVIGFEADIDSPDFKGIYQQDVKMAQFSENEELGARANGIMNAAVGGQENAVVNLPATVHEAFKRWLSDYGILELANDNQIELVKWFVVTGEYDSLNSLKISLDTFGKQIPHVVVKNQKYTDWIFFDEFQELQTLIQETDSKVIDLPKLPARVASTLLQERLSFELGKSYNGKSFGIVEQAAVKGYLRSAYAQFESTGLL